jgi:hypothetical protein
MLKDVGSASVCPKCVLGQLNVAIANVDLDKAAAFISLQTRDMVGVELLALLETDVVLLLLSSDSLLFSLGIVRGHD